MSLILDALNRADQERSEEKSAANLHANIVPSVADKSPLLRWIVEAVIIILVAGALIYSQFIDNGAVTTQHTLVKIPELAPIELPTSPVKTAIIKPPPQLIKPLQQNHANIDLLYQQQSQSDAEKPAASVFSA